MKKLLVFAGSARKDSVNKKLSLAAAELACEAGADVTHIDLADYPAPIYNGDIEAEQGLPSSIQSFKKLCSTHDGLIIVTPEYNGCLPPLLINLLSWASRAEGDESAKAVFMNKPVAIAAASPGRLGGVRVIPRLRDYLSELGFIVVPGFVTLPGAYQAFDEQGKLLDENASATLKRQIDHLLTF